MCLWCKHENFIREMVPKTCDKKGRNRRREIEIRKEPLFRQGYSSKGLVIYYIIVESECVEIKLMELKIWNRTHTKHVF